MGRRSINTTKSGKYMNPTDQARKEARKKELKKNKKQRQAVRTAVLKGKDPHQIISELEKIDNMEYNVMQPSPLNEKVLKDKRKKLKETFNRVLKLYNKEEPEKWVDMKKLEGEYEKRRNMMITFYESVKYAQHVQVDDIPLPSLTLPDALPSSIPLPAELPHFLASAVPHVHSILKKTSAYGMVDGVLQCPGVPPFPPPELSDDEEEMEVAVELPEADVSERPRTIRFAEDAGPPLEEPPEEEEGEEEEEEMEREEAGPGEGEGPSKPQPTALQQKMLQMAGQDIDEFMREMEEVHRRREQDRQADLTSRLSRLEPEPSLEEDLEPRGDPRDSRGESRDSRGDSRGDIRGEPRGESRDKEERPPGVSSLPSKQMPAAPNAAVPGPPPLMFRPLMRPPILPPGMRMPPGPPPGRPPGPPAGLPPRLAMRLPPGPPPGLPPPRLMGGLPRPPGLPTLGIPLPGPPGVVPPGLLPNPNVVSAAPQLISRQQRELQEATKKQMQAQQQQPPQTQPQGATIEAKPQIRNLSADVTRFLPASVRARREEKPKRVDPRAEAASLARAHHLAQAAAQAAAKQPQNKDDAYMQFMREMEGLL